ncbi:MAG: T9SS type A sorting domain-containing protein [Saprospiraceae bacterium]
MVTNCGISYCPLSNLVLDTQEKINQFTLNYPGCTELSVGMIISGGDIVDLTPLQIITSLNGDLTISNNSSLTTLNGIENFVAGATSLRVQDNPVLIDIEAISVFEIPLTKNVWITDNSLLTICDYGNLCNYYSEKLDGNLFHGNGGECWNITALLASCAGDAICPEGDIIFSSQTEVDLFSAIYPNCTIINGSVSLAPKADIENLDALKYIEHITGNLQITNNKSFIRLGLENLERVDGNIKLENTGLDNLAGLEKLLYVNGYLKIGYNNHLISLDGPNDLITVGGLKIEHNPELSDLKKFTPHIDGYLKIRNNLSLETLSNFQFISVAFLDDLEIINNSALAFCSDTRFCEYLATDKPRTIFGNSGSCETEATLSLTCTNNPCGDENLILTSQQEVDDFPMNYPDCSIWNADITVLGNTISNLDSLHQIVIVMGELIIEGTALTNLSGLDQLLMINRNCKILDNDNLLSIEGLPELRDSLIVQDNDLLSECAIEAVCNYIYNFGDALFSNNALGCETTDEVESYCASLNETCGSVSFGYYDAEENSDGKVNNGSSDLEMSIDKGQQIVGLSFSGLNIPAAAIIEKASIQFTSDQTDNVSPCELQIYGELNAAGEPFYEEPFNISNRTKTSNSVTWSPDEWTEKNQSGEAQRTVDFSSIVQEIVNLENYSTATEINFIIEGTGKRTADSYDGNEAGAPKLCVVYREEEESAAQYSNQNNNAFTNNSEAKKIKAYPNPVRNILTLNLEDFDLKNTAVNMYNTMGVRILTEIFSERTPSKVSISVEHLPKGLYYLMVDENGENLDNIKIVIE